jgi:hypothetical protein
MSTAFKGEWLTDNCVATEVKIRRTTGRFRPVKNGWELVNHLVYCDPNYNVWVCSPGYLWDGPSYPSNRTLVGKALKGLIGYRKKKGLLAASAHHDQMCTDGRPSLVYKTTPEGIQTFKKALESNTIGSLLETMHTSEVYLNIPQAAELYKNMLRQWMVREETISGRQAIRQYVGLILFQPWYRLLTPTNTPWEKV